MTRLRAMLNGARVHAVSALPDLLLLAGTVLLSYGAWLVYQPAGYITAGVLLLVAGVLAARKGQV